MNPGKLFEDLATATWQRLADGDRLKVRQGETTITDLLLLELARLGPPAVHVLKTPQDKEDAQGTDWEWWIGTPLRGWLRYAVQAKRIDVDSERYDQIGHKVNGRLQLDILRTYASANRAIPLYCLYNHALKPRYDDYWHCHRPIDPRQLGCSIAPLRVVEKALRRRGARCFEWIHRKENVLPWRCLVRCPAFVEFFSGVTVASRRLMLTQAAEFFGEEPVLYPVLPAGFPLRREIGVDSFERPLAEPIEQLEAFDPQFYSADTIYLPRRIAVVDLTESADLP